MNLYIIGNGFDLMHNLPTRYSDFAKFCKENYKALYLEMMRCFNKLDKVKLWMNFEDALGFPDRDYIQRNYERVKKANRDGKISVEIEELKEAFSAWITRISPIIATYKGEKFFAFKNDDAFVNFNYTDTLEKIYDIHHDILHIHGGGEELEKIRMDEIPYTGYIFGHCEELPNNEEFEIREDSRYLRKDFQYTELENFLVNKQVDNIVVIGHSMAKVDYGYFKMINKTFPKSLWMIYYHDGDDKKRKMNSIKDCGIENCNMVHEQETKVKK